MVVQGKLAVAEDNRTVAVRDKLHAAAAAVPDKLLAAVAAVPDKLAVVVVD